MCPDPGSRFPSWPHFNSYLMLEEGVLGGGQTPFTCKGHEPRCGPLAAGDPQMVEGGLETWDTVFLGASPLLCQPRPYTQPPHFKT